ncbi:hypothetical protein GGF41_005303, partial [Coemansia sp. RSA 2531]
KPVLPEETRLPETYTHEGVKIPPAQDKKCPSAKKETHLPETDTLPLSYQNNRIHS